MEPLESFCSCGCAMTVLNGIAWVADRYILYTLLAGARAAIFLAGRG